MIIIYYYDRQYPYEGKAGTKNSLYAHSLFLNLLFEARLKLHKKKQLPKCKTSNIDVSLI